MTRFEIILPDGDVLTFEGREAAGAKLRELWAADPDLEVRVRAYRAGPVRTAPAPAEEATPKGGARR